MIKKVSDKELALAERINSIIQDKIHKYFMESVNSDIFCSVKVLVPITENINMEFMIDVPKEMMDEDNTTLLEYFVNHIYRPNDKYMTESINAAIIERDEALKRLEENVKNFDPDTFFEEFGAQYDPPCPIDTPLPGDFDGDLLDTPIDGMFFEMADVKGGFMSIKLSVWGDEGKYPHFHFYHGVSPNQGIPNKGRGGGCILIKEAKYFIHSSHRDTMEKKEIEGLIKFLKSEHPLYGISIWEVIIDTWNENNKDQPQVSLDAPIPPYTHDMPSIKED